MPDNSLHYKGEVSEHALIFNEYSELLLIQNNGGGRGPKNPRLESPHYGKWHFVGGRMDETDQPGEGLLREIFEETGLQNVELILPCHVSRWGFGVPIKYSVAYLARVQGRPEITLPEDENAMAYRWVPLAEVPQLTLLTEKHYEVVSGVVEWGRKLGVITNA